MLAVLTVPIRCERCRQSGAARWLEDGKSEGRQRLVALSEGFCSVDRGQQEPDILCMHCNDTHRAGAEARSALSARPQRSSAVNL